jgi:hypothetical protein
MPTMGLTISVGIVIMLLCVRRMAGGQKVGGTVWDVRLTGFGSLALAETFR